MRQDAHGCGAAARPRAAPSGALIARQPAGRPHGAWRFWEGTDLLAVEPQPACTCMRGTEAPLRPAARDRLQRAARAEVHASTPHAEPWASLPSERCPYACCALPVTLLHVPPHPPKGPGSNSHLDCKSRPIHAVCFTAERQYDCSNITLTVSTASKRRCVGLVHLLTATWRHRYCCPSEAAGRPPPGPAYTGESWSWENYTDRPCGGPRTWPPLSSSCGQRVTD